MRDLYISIYYEMLVDKARLYLNNGVKYAYCYIDKRMVVCQITPHDGYITDRFYYQYGIFTRQK